MIEMLGQRDANCRAEIGVRSIADRVRLHSALEVRHDPEVIAAPSAGPDAARYDRHRECL
jgi:hypothetical protein